MTPTVQSRCGDGSKENCPIKASNTAIMERQGHTAALTTAPAVETWRASGPATSATGAGSEAAASEGGCAASNGGISGALPRQGVSFALR